MPDSMSATATPDETNAASARASADATVEELRALLAEAEQALANTGEYAHDELSSLRGRLRSALDQGKETAHRAYDMAREKALLADEQIRMHPYAAIGIAAGIGILAGALLGRSSRH